MALRVPFCRKSGGISWGSAVASEKSSQAGGITSGAMKQEHLYGLLKAGFLRVLCGLSHNYCDYERKSVFGSAWALAKPITTVTSYR